MHFLAMLCLCPISSSLALFAAPFPKHPQPSSSGLCVLHNEAAAHQKSPSFSTLVVRGTSGPPHLVPVTKGTTSVRCDVPWRCSEEWLREGSLGAALFPARDLSL